jgi:hypothetical protein
MLNALQARRVPSPIDVNVIGTNSLAGSIIDELRSPMGSVVPESNTKLKKRVRSWNISYWTSSSAARSGALDREGDQFDVFHISREPCLPADVFHAAASAFLPTAFATFFAGVFGSPEDVPPIRAIPIREESHPLSAFRDEPENSSAQNAAIQKALGAYQHLYAELGGSMQVTRPSPLGARPHIAPSLLFAAWCLDAQLGPAWRSGCSISPLPSVRSYRRTRERWRKQRSLWQRLERMVHRLQREASRAGLARGQVEHG